MAVSFEDQLILSGDMTRTFAFPRDGSTGSRDSVTGAWGDYNGLEGILTADGRVHLMTAASTIRAASIEQRIAHVAVTGTGRVAAIPRQTSRSHMMHILEFKTTKTFNAWLTAPSDGNSYPAAHHMVSGRPSMLKAYQTGFALLNEAGEVYTWGDARHSACLGRLDPDSADNEPADKPAIVKSLGGLKVVKLDTCSGGWFTGAVTDAGHAVLWGWKPGAHEDRAEIEDLASGRALGETCSSLKLPSVATDDDIMDIAIGAGHVLVLCASGQVWSVGDGRYGQLGHDKLVNGFSRQWMKVAALDDLKKDGKNVSHIVCGDLTSFLVIADSNPTT